MATEVNLSLPQRSGRRNSQGPVLLVLICVMIAISATTLVVLVFDRTASRKTWTGLDRHELEDLAITLEQRHLYDAAAGAWREYLDEGGRNRREQGAIWYRIGKSYEEAGQYESALDAYYRSERLGADEEIALDRGLRIQESRERLGKFAALRSELSSRTSVGSPNEEVVAEIGVTKIRKSDLDAMIQERIADELASYRGIMTEDELNAQKEKLFSAYATGEQRSRMLTQYIARELLSRKAREDGLADDPDVRRRILDSESGLLAGEELSSVIADRVHITDADLRSYFSNHVGQYVDNESDPPIQRSFEEAKNDVYADLYAERAGAVQNDLMNELRDRYDVVIHQSALTDAAGGGPGAEGEN